MIHGHMCSIQLHKIHIFFQGSAGATTPATAHKVFQRHRSADLLQPLTTYFESHMTQVRRNIANSHIAFGTGRRSSLPMVGDSNNGMNSETMHF